MALSFDDLKKHRAENLIKNKQKFSSATTPQTSFESDDNRLWKPTADKAGNGFAVIRFLPAPAGEDDPFVRMFSHGFQGPSGSWYIENSLTTLGQDDPVGKLNSTLWNSGLESDKEIARKQKRRLNFYSNIYVVKDPGNPDNEGKVFLYKYGKKIFDKLNAAMNPELDDEEPIDPFDLWGGANFKLKFSKGQYGYDYSSSVFQTPGPLFKKDDDMEAVYKQCYSLQEIIDPKNFKTYEELEAKLTRVLGGAPRRVASITTEGIALPSGKTRNVDEDEISEDDSLTSDEIESMLKELG